MAVFGNRRATPRQLAIGASAAVAAVAVVIAAVVLSGNSGASKTAAPSKAPIAATSSDAATASSLDLTTVDWSSSTVPGKACMSTTPIKLRNGAASITYETYPGTSFELNLTMAAQYGQLANGGPMVAAFGLSCSGVGEFAGTGAHVVKQVSVAVFDAVSGKPKLLGLVTNLELGRLADDQALVPDHIEIKDGTVVLTGSYLQPQDADCCPSGRASATISYANQGLIWTPPVATAGTPSNSSNPAAPTASITAAPAPTAAAGPVRVVNITAFSGQQYQVSVVAEDMITDCAANSYGAAVIAFFTQHPCSEGANRLLFTVPLGGRTVALSLISVSIPGASAEVAYANTGQFTHLENEDGTGSINDLLRAGTRLSGWPTSIPADEAFEVTGQDNVVWIFDAWYLSGPTTDQAPELIALENDLFLQPLFSPTH